MPIWEVEYTDEFEAWFDELTAEQQLSIDDCVAVLQRDGPQLGEPLVKLIVSSRYANLKELRCSKGGALRVLFISDPRRGHPAPRR